MIQTLTNLTDSARTLLVAVGFVVAIFVVLSTYARTRSLPATAMSAVVAALVLFAINNPEILQGKAEEDLSLGGATATTTAAASALGA